MDLNPLTSVLKAVASPVTTWIEGRNTVSKAKAEAEAEVVKTAAKSSADWEKIQAVNAGQSWKDEWLTLLFSIPLILCFFPDTVVYVQNGFDALEQMPDWYQYTLSVIVAASFGVRSAIGLMKAKK